MLARGNSDTSGPPGRKSKRGGWSAPGAGTASAAGMAASDTRVGAPWVRDEVALRRQLRVRVDDHAARDAQLARERARRRQREARRQASRAHRVAQLLLDLGP